MKNHIALIITSSLLISCDIAFIPNGITPYTEPVPVTYTITIGTVTGGHAVVSPQKDAYLLNEKVKISAAPDSGYMFSSWDSPYSAEKDSFEVVMDTDKIISPVFTQRKWTFIVYMAAENDLEAAAIADFNEMESIATSKASSVLVLFDRINGYDATNGDWTDTRLFEIRHDPNGNNNTIVSERINCPELGLSTDTVTELNMADPLVLSNLISFAKRAYPAENYTLIIWGHGTGWRSDGAVVSSTVEPLKAVAFDDSTGGYMPISALGSAVSGKRLSVIAFDTCFGALMEIAFELKDSAEWLIGSEGLISSTGWDYADLFSSFNSTPLSVSDFCDSAIGQFKNQYSGANGSTISQMRLSETDLLFSSFEAFSKEIAVNITTPAVRDVVLNAILHDTDVFHFASFPADLYVDLYSFTDKMISISTAITANTANQDAILAAGNTLKGSIDQMVASTWSKKDDFSRKNIGVYVIPLQSLTAPAASHSQAYIKGTPDFDKSAFVEASEYWVPHATPKTDSLLDKLFYWSY